VSPRRKICVVTGTRADYGLLRELMRQVAANQALALQIAVTGMHLAPEFGLTVNQIEADGLPVDEKVEMLLSSDTVAGVGKSMGLGTIGFADALQRLDPDILVVLGDRFEILAAAMAALVARIPIAHIHGGETTEGAFDESIRHALTKMAQWHFVAAEPYRKRVVQLGESPDRVFVSGAPGLDGLSRATLMDRAALAASLGIPLGELLFLVTYHPATRGDRNPEAAQAELLAALDAFPQASVILTLPNADPAGRGLAQQALAWCRANSGRAAGVPSLGQQRYLSAMALADITIGNSSSGLIETPALKRATVNIGPRQQGRLKASSVIDAREDRDDIVRAIRQALSPEFRQTLPDTVSLYGQGNASSMIAATLASVPLGEAKSFFDIAHGY
jgi:UDP-hydrolysing UDP-N-acetyl-D-glucosamine 2-epimerase